jgi:hypothetical protein
MPKEKRIQTIMNRDDQRDSKTKEKTQQEVANWK